MQMECMQKEEVEEEEELVRLTGKVMLNVNLMMVALFLMIRSLDVMVVEVREEDYSMWVD